MTEIIYVKNNNSDLEDIRIILTEAQYKSVEEQLDKWENQGLMTVSHVEKWDKEYAGQPARRVTFYTRLSRQIEKILNNEDIHAPSVVKLIETLNIHFAQPVAVPAAFVEAVEAIEDTDTPAPVAGAEQLVKALDLTGQERAMVMRATNIIRNASAFAHSRVDPLYLNVLNEYLSKTDASLTEYRQWVKDMGVRFNV